MSVGIAPGTAVQRLQRIAPDEYHLDYDDEWCHTPGFLMQEATAAALTAAYTRTVPWHAQLGAGG